MADTCVCPAWAADPDCPLHRWAPETPVTNVAGLLAQIQDLEAENAQLRALTVRADSVLSLIYYRESSALSDRTRADVAALIGPLRKVSDQR